MWADLRSAFPLLCSNPGFTILAVCTLGLALGRAPLCSSTLTLSTASAPG